MAIMENAAVSMNIQVFVERGFSFLLGVDLGVAVLGQMVTLCLRFWETARLFSNGVYPLHILTNNIPRF